MAQGLVARREVYRYHCRSTGPGICIYNSANMEQVRTVPHTDELESIQHLAWSRDGTKLVYTASNYMEVIDATSGRSIREIWHDGHVQVKFGCGFNSQPLPNNSLMLTRLTGEKSVRLACQVPRQSTASWPSRRAA